MSSDSEDDAVGQFVVGRKRCSDPRSRFKYNIFCRILLCWVEPLFWTGCRRNLTQSDLYAHPDEVDSEKLLKNFNKYWEQEVRKKQQGGKARLSLALLKCIWWRFLLIALLYVLEVVLFYIQSVVVGYLSEYFVENSSVTTRDAYIYATALVVLSVMVLLVHGVSFISGQKCGMIVRIIMTGAIYQKAMKLSQTSVGHITIGRVINLASNDVQRFDMALMFIHFIWITPLLIVAYVVLVYIEVGNSALIAAVFIVLQLPLQIGLSSLFGKVRLKSASVTDKRVKVMNEVISGMRVIKMYAWEYTFKRMVEKIRRNESKLILLASFLRFNTEAWRGVFEPIVMFLTFSAYVSLEGSLTAKSVFTTLSLTILLRRYVANFFARAVFQCREAFVAIKRVKELLEYEELTTDTSRGHGPPANALESDPLVLMESVSASWTFDPENMTLSNVSCRVDQESRLLAIVGPVGAGKSTVLQCLLRELEPLEGSITIKGRLSMTSQDPWVFSGTLRENILFGLPYEDKWYNQVLYACALKKDISQLARGDHTLVGERGVTLSGGQKARVNLARAIYRKADVYILDDPLSAVDSAVARHIFEKCIQGVLKKKLVVLVTHQLHFAQMADKILALRNGQVEALGTLSELQMRGMDPTKLTGVQKEEPNKVKENVIVAQLGETVPRKNNFRGSMKYLELIEDTLEENDAISPSFSKMSLSSVIGGGEEGVSEVPSEEKSHGSISIKTYYKYFKAGVYPLLLLLILGIIIIGEGGAVLADWWISDWVECSSYVTCTNVSSLNDTLCTNNATWSRTCALKRSERIGAYAGITGGAILFSFIRSYVLLMVFINASRVLHNRMFRSLLRAPMRFFDTNPSGRILNRFSKDVGFLDDLLPFQFTTYMFLTTKCLAILVTATVANRLIAIPAVVVVLFFLVFRWYYLKTSREVKRLEAIARSPLYSHISMTLQGLSTIRVFGSQEFALSAFHDYQNEHSKGWYLYLVINRWFGMRVDFISALFLACVAFASIPLVDNSIVDRSLVGLALTYSISLAGSLQFNVRLSAEIENLMVSAERVIQYGALQPEASLETVAPNNKPPSDWPEKGDIVMDDASFQYSPDTPLVLNSVCCEIKPSQKVGIVGRTGAGKSSIVAMLFRLAEPYGIIRIDGVNICEIGLHQLRKNISIIPQDPVLFSGSVRYNLDPFEQYSDADLWDVLEQVQLKCVVEDLDRGLDAKVSEGGSNFSVGQRQLVCLARALLRRNKILVLDEATANVDMKTDEIIQKAIHEQFSDCTVLTIAHRLNTIVESDQILVLDGGWLKENGQPHMLLSNSDSLLTKMVEQTGAASSRKLHQMAQDAFSRQRVRVGNAAVETTL